MKKIISFFAAAVIVLTFSCGTYSPEKGFQESEKISRQEVIKVQDPKEIIDFSKPQIVASSASFGGKVIGYAFDSVEVVIFEGHNSYCLRPVQVLFYINESKEIRFEYRMPKVDGEVRKSIPLSTVRKFKMSLTAQNKDGTLMYPGMYKMLNINGIAFIFVSKEERAEELFKKIESWMKAVKPAPPPPKNYSQEA